ncbi:MAG: sigma-70 family RNA polymerase sigma factor [Solirubrobacterales bacterium]|nr:sigma-70 family RNA polymerase sigma factor [Solirubrobacterales bacterium]
MSQPVASGSEPDLVAAVRAGNDLAFEELYSRYRSRISSYILGIVRDQALAEDVAQEVFISALRRMRATQQPISFKPWIYEIAKNASLDELRRARRTREISVEIDGDPERLPFATTLGADAAVEGKQQLQDLRGAFRGLSDTHHRIIVLRELEGRSYKEIGEQMGLSKPVVESTLFRARRRLGEEYEELVSGRRCEQTQCLIAAGEERTWKSLGMRQRRQLARHLAHCQSCRRAAREAGIDERFFDDRGVVGKLAGLLPLPWLRSRRGRHTADAQSGSDVPKFSLLAPLQSVAPYFDQVPSAVDTGRAAVAAAALVIGGGSLVSGLGATSGAHNHPAAPPGTFESGAAGRALATSPLVLEHHPALVRQPASDSLGRPKGKLAPGHGASAQPAAPSSSSSVPLPSQHTPSLAGAVRTVTGKALQRPKLPSIRQTPVVSHKGLHLSGNAIAIPIDGSANVGSLQKQIPVLQPAPPSAKRFSSKPPSAGASSAGKSSQPPGG